MQFPSLLCLLSFLSTNLINRRYRFSFNSFWRRILGRTFFLLFYRNSLRLFWCTVLHLCHAPITTCILCILPLPRSLSTHLPSPRSIHSPPQHPSHPNLRLLFLPFCNRRNLPFPARKPHQRWRQIVLVAERRWGTPTASETGYDSWRCRRRVGRIDRRVLTAKLSRGRKGGGARNTGHVAEKRLWLCVCGCEIGCLGCRDGITVAGRASCRTGCGRCARKVLWKARNTLCSAHCSGYMGWVWDSNW